MGANNTVSIYFSKEEYEKIEKASEYGVLGWSPLMKVLIKNGLEKLLASEKLVFIFNQNETLNKEIYKTKVIRLDDRGYDEMKKICASTPFSMSNLAKYLIMPQVDEAIARKGWNY